MPKILIYALFISIVSACGAGSGEGLDGNGVPVGSQTPPDGGGGGEPPTVATLEEIQDTIFTPICSVCHTGALAPQGLRLDSLENSFAFLVNVSSEQRSELLRVDPGNADNSYLVNKIEGIDIVQAQMPLGQAALSATQITLVRDWIDAGALQASASQASTKVVMSKATTLDDVLRVDLRFSRALDTSSISINDLVVTLQGDSGDQLVATQDMVMVVDSAALEIIYDGELADYKQVVVELNRPELSSVMDERGRLLDGDSDNQDGGVYRYVYSF